MRRKSAGAKHAPVTTVVRRNLRNKETFHKLRDGRLEDARLAAEDIDPKAELSSRGPLFYVAARKDSLGGAEELFRTLRRRQARLCYDKSMQTPLFVAAMEGNAKMCKYLVQKQGLDVNHQDMDGETPIYQAIKNEHLEATITLLRCGASLGSVNKRQKCAASYCSRRFAERLRKRREDWQEPQQTHSRKRKQTEDISLASGPQCLEAWAQKRAKCHVEEPLIPASGNEVIAENDTHFIVNMQASALGKLRELEKQLIVDQAKVLRGDLMHDACRTRDWCEGLGAIYDDRKSTKVFNAIMKNGERSINICLLAVSKQTETVVGFCHASMAGSDLALHHVKVAQGHEGKGIGRLLINATEMAATRRGWKFHRVKLAVLQENLWAKRAFQQMGFQLDPTCVPDPARCPFTRCDRLVRAPR